MPKVKAKKGDFAKNWQKLGGSPPAPPPMPEILKNLTSLLSRVTGQSQKTQCYSTGDQTDCFGTAF